MPATLGDLKKVTISYQILATTAYLALSLKVKKENQIDQYERN